MRLSCEIIGYILRISHYKVHPGQTKYGMELRLMLISLNFKIWPFDRRKSCQHPALCYAKIPRLLAFEHRCAFFNGSFLYLLSCRSTWCCLGGSLHTCSLWWFISWHPVYKYLCDTCLFLLLSFLSSFFSPLSYIPWFHVCSDIFFCNLLYIFNFFLSLLA